MKGNRGRSRLRAIIIGGLAAIFLVSGGMTVRHHIEDGRALKEYSQLAELSQSVSEAGTKEAGAALGTIPEAATEVAPVASGEEPGTRAYVSPIDFDELKKANPDIVGWIKMPGTRIDYPIVQGTDNDFYLCHDFHGNKSAGGGVYLDYESQRDMEGRNTILYGHNMKNGSMFKDLVKYKDEDFFKKHQYFTIYTPDREIRLKAVSCYYGEAKPIVRKTRFKTQASFDAFVREMIRPCSFCGDVAFPVKSLYTLVTCSYEVDNGRTFLYAVEADP